MQENFSIFKVPSFAKRETYDFDAGKDFLNIYKELTNIAEEIEECRLRNL